MVNCWTQKPTHLLRVLVVVMVQKSANHGWRDGKKTWYGMANKVGKAINLISITVCTVVLVLILVLKGILHQKLRESENV